MARYSVNTLNAKERIDLEQTSITGIIPDVLSSHRMDCTIEPTIYESMRTREI